MEFPAAIEAQLDGSLARCDVLLRFDFASGAKRIWNGFGPLTTNDGQVWEGLGGLGSIEGLTQTINGASSPLDLTVSGVDTDFAATARGERADWFNAAVLCYWQFFDENWQPIDNPMPFRFGRLKNLTSSRQWDATDKKHIYTVSMRAEGLFINQRRPRWGFYSDSDQRGRFPGDKFCERIAGIDGRVIEWP